MPVSVTPPTASTARCGLRPLSPRRSRPILHTLLGRYSWVHTLNNAAEISIALLWGESFMGAASISISGGRDTDSTTATVGSVYGALHGDAAIPIELVGTTHVHVRSAVRDFDRITISELSERTIRLVLSLPDSAPPGSRP